MNWASLIAHLVKNLPAMQETWVQLLGREKEMATPFSITAWRIPWTEEPGRLQSMGSQELDMTYRLKRERERERHPLSQVWGESTAAGAAAKSLQSCPTLCEPIDGSPPGSPIPGILQERTLEWGAISFSNA